MKCNYPKESDACAFHYNGICTRDHNYECPALAMKNLSHGEMVQIAEGKKNKTPRYIDANKLIDMATHEGAYGYVDVHDIHNAPTADVVERTQGKWMRNNNGTYSCSLCQSWIPKEQRHYANWCLFCGADMRGDGNDN